MSNSIIEKKAFAFAKRMVDLYQHLRVEKKEYIISKQIFRSGTSIGANITEGLEGESRIDFKRKLSISLKETSETIYWLKLLHYGNYITDREFRSFYQDATEIKRILTSIIKTLKKHLRFENRVKSKVILK